MSSVTFFGADIAQPLWDDEPCEGAFQLDQTTNLDTTVVKQVSRPWLFGYKPAKSNGRAILILAGGGYIELMAGKEGVIVARWLTSLGFNAYVLIHRFPNRETGSHAPVDDARKALCMIKEGGLASNGLGICGLSSGGHLGAALLADYPTEWPSKDSIPTIDFAIIGYGPISTNAVGRQIIANKPPLEPPEKQKLYDTVQPDVQMIKSDRPTFIVYSGNDPIVPVVNAYRLAEAITQAGGSVELHVFADAPHGFALDTNDLPVSKWPEMCEAWMKQNHIL